MQHPTSSEQACDVIFKTLSYANQSSPHFRANQLDHITLHQSGLLYPLRADSADAFDCLLLGLM